MKNQHSRGAPNPRVTSRPSPRAREPIGRSFGNIRGKFPSRKMGRMIHWESQLERDAVLLFEFSPGILAYREQPIRIHYSLDGKTRRYTPDFEVTLHTSDVHFIEVKPLEKTLDPEESNRLRRIQEHFERDGNTLRIITEIDIRQPVLLENLRVLFRYRRAALCAFDQRMARKRFNSADAITFRDAATLIGGDQEVWHLIDQEILTCDLRNEITSKTILKITNEGEKNEELYI